MQSIWFIDRLSIWFGRTFSYVYLLSVVVTVYEVAADYLFRAPGIWAHDSTIILSSIGFLFGGAYALQRREHIRITSIYESMSPRAQKICDGVWLVLAILYLAALGWFAAKQAIESITIPGWERSGRAWNVPMPVPIRWALFLGTVLLILQALAQLWGLLRGGKQQG
jgi:TRAP-type mannitol/chloroaromatic compound transport system permease small subunit